jgi:hypothetical protein
MIEAWEDGGKEGWILSRGWLGTAQRQKERLAEAGCWLGEAAQGQQASMIILLLGHGRSNVERHITSDRITTQHNTTQHVMSQINSIEVGR